jgi:aldehyde dehydrogenase
MAPALGAGHTVVLKLPKTRCISVLEFIKEIAQVLPPGVVNVVTDALTSVGCGRVALLAPKFLQNR